MPLVQDVKALVERTTGIGRPSRVQLKALLRTVKPLARRFDDDGKTPNSRLPLLAYRRALRLDPAFDPAAICEDAFAANGWRHAWRDGIYPFRHFHTNTHEVLGIARGRVSVEFGGAAGERIALEVGDVVLIPAGVSHKRVGGSGDLLVVGAYPGNGDYDEVRPCKRTPPPALPPPGCACLRKIRFTEAAAP
jgi:uncharacterized protein YjlB